jgi:hypothetical protein
MRVSSFRNLVAALAMALVASACGDVARTGRSPAYLVIGSFDAASGADPEQFSGTLHSDVVTIVEVKQGEQTFFVPTFFNDLGRASFRVALKDPGPAVTPTIPSSLNAITITRYRVEYLRSDGRNTQGVDVPYAFDGGLTLTVPNAGTVSGVFDLVRHTAKSEAPLLALQNNGGAQMINTLARVTFFGRDQAGNDVSAEAMISVSFANFGDPQ